MNLRQTLTNHHHQRLLFVLSVLVPMWIIFAIFWIYPLFDGFWGSLHQWSAFNPERTFIGFDNYSTLMGDRIFRTAVVNTFEYTLMYLPASVLISLTLALAVNATGRFQDFFRTVYFLPVVTSVIATSLIFNWLYQPRFGLINQFLQYIGLNQQMFLRSPGQALPSIAAYAVWKNLGFNMVLFMAGLSSIPRIYYDAAQVDGASTWQRFTRITLPLLRPTTVFVVITGVIDTLQVFGPVYVMTAATNADMPGGPLNSTMVLSVYQWETAFRTGDFGYGAAIGIMLFVIVLAATALQALILRGRGRNIS